MASGIVGPKGRVVGVDIAAIDPPIEYENVFSIQGDFSELPVLEAVIAELGAQADCVISDAAPKLTGIRVADRAREEACLEAIEATLSPLLRGGGSFLAKLLECPEAHAFELRIKKRFSESRALKTKATRKGSSERYLIARGFKPDA